jgi:lipid-A-disaccharide synthase
MNPTIFLSTAEFSGDMHGEALIQELKKLLPEASFYGIGGPRMAAAGMELIYDPTRRSTIGFVEVLRNLGKAKRILTAITKAWAKRRPALVIWLDSGGFNLMVAKAAKERGIPVVCIFSPSAWAYGWKRAVKLAERVELLLAVLPFEAEFYRGFGVNTVYIGHPLLDRVKPERNQEEVRHALDLVESEKLVVLMPGSRRQEIERLLGPMLTAAAAIDRDQFVKWVLPVAASLDRKWLETLIAKYPVQVKPVSGITYDVLAAADAAIIASGTATLEAAILGTPMVVAYKVSKLSVFVYKMLENKDHRGKPWRIALPNLILDRDVVPEFIQKETTPKNIYRALREILTEPERDETIRRELDEVKCLIGPPGVMERAARQCVDLINKDDLSLALPLRGE